MARAVLDRFDVTAVIVWVARSARGRVRNVQVCYRRWAQTPVRLGLDRRVIRPKRIYNFCLLHASFG